MQQKFVIKKNFAISGIGAFALIVLAAILFWIFAKAILITLLVILIIVFLVILFAVGTDESDSEDHEAKVRTEVHSLFRDLGRVVIRTPDSNFLDVSIYDDKKTPKFATQDWSDLVFSTGGEWMTQGDLTSILFYEPPLTTSKKIVFGIPFDAFEGDDSDVDQLIGDLTLLAARLKKTR